MKARIEQLLREARATEPVDSIKGPPLRPGFVERVLTAKNDEGQEARRLRSLVLGGSLAGAGLSVVVAALVSWQVQQRALNDAAEIWSMAVEEQGGQG